MQMLLEKKNTVFHYVFNRSVLNTGNYCTQIIRGYTEKFSAHATFQHLTKHQNLKEIVLCGTQNFSATLIEVALTVLSNYVIPNKATGRK